MIMTNAWLVWRCLHPEKRTTFREFQLLFCMEKYDAPWFCFTNKDKHLPSVNLRGKKRFTGKPISELKPAVIRAELGPRSVDWDRSIIALRLTQRKRASIWMDYLIQPTKKRSLCCCHDNSQDDGMCSLKTTFMCAGCGARACFKEGINHMKRIHLRYFRARKRLRAAL